MEQGEECTREEEERKEKECRHEEREKLRSEGEGREGVKEGKKKKRGNTVYSCKTLFTVGTRN